MLTITNTIGLLASIATVLLVAYDHRKWSQTNRDAGFIAVGWALASALACMNVLMLGTNAYGSAVAPLAVAVALLAISSVVRYRATQPITAPRSNSPTRRNDKVYTITTAH